MPSLPPDWNSKRSPPHPLQAFLDLRQLMQIVEAIFGACIRLGALVQVGDGPC